jgi:hypothetical protein
MTDLFLSLSQLTGIDEGVISSRVNTRIKFDGLLEGTFPNGMIIQHMNINIKVQITAFCREFECCVDVLDGDGIHHFCEKDRGLTYVIYITPDGFRSGYLYTDKGKNQL